MVVLVVMVVCGGGEICCQCPVCIVSKLATSQCLHNIPKKQIFPNMVGIQATGSTPPRIPSPSTSTGNPKEKVDKRLMKYEKEGWEVDGVMVGEMRKTRRMG